MKALLVSLALVLLSVSSMATARQNPAVQPIFFEHLHDALPQSQPAPVSQAGNVEEVTLGGLAWAVENLKNDPTPIVIEFFSSRAADCAVSNTGKNECTLQPAAINAAAARYPGRVKFLRVDVAYYPVLLQGPDVRVLPSHIVISSYVDTTHYTAIKVGGYLSAAQLQSLVKEVCGIDP